MDPSNGCAIEYIPGEWDPHPASPWAQRFGPSNDSFWRDHSGLAPEFPSLGVHDYSEDALPPRGTSLPKPTPRELDRLFYGERWQQEILFGVKSWQLAALNSEPYGYETTGDCIPTWSLDPAWDRYYQERIIPNERGWFPFFQRGRWFDLRTNAIASIRNPFPEIYDHQTNWWTADNDVIWDHLSVSIEMANRILVQLIQEQDTWLEALLFREREDLFMFDEAVRQRFLNEMQYNPQILRQHTDKRFCVSRDALAKRLTDLNRRTIFCFADESGGFDTFQVYGFCWHTDLDLDRDQNLPPWTTVYVNVSTLRALCDRDTSLSERANSHINLTITIIHELMRKQS